MSYYPPDQGYPPQGYPPQGYPPQNPYGAPPPGYGGYPPQGYPPPQPYGAAPYPVFGGGYPGAPEEPYVFVAQPGQFYGGSEQAQFVGDRLDSSGATGPREIRSSQKLSSKNGNYHLVVQPDGNLVLYEFGSHPVWASHTSAPHLNGPNHRVVAQEDANLVLYDGNNNVRWASHTSNHRGNPPYLLVLQDDRNVVLYDGASKPVWSTHTWKK